MEALPSQIPQELIERTLARRRLIKPDFRDEEEVTEMLQNRIGRVLEYPELTEIEKIADAVVFDWDGVLYDSVDESALAGSQLLGQLGVSITPKDFKHSYSAPYGHYMSSHGISMETEEERQRVHTIFHQEILPKLKQKEGATLAKVFEGVVEVIEELKKKGVKTAIISAAVPGTIEKELQAIGAEHLFDEILSGKHEKSDSISNFCERMGVDKKRVIMFGDLPSDLRDAKKAGVMSAGVALFPEAKDRLGAYDPDFLVTKLTDILKLQSYVDQE